MPLVVARARMQQDRLAPAGLSKLLRENCSAGSELARVEVRDLPFSVAFRAALLRPAGHPGN